MANAARTTCSKKQGYHPISFARSDLLSFCGWAFGELLHSDLMTKWSWKKSLEVGVAERDLLNVLLGEVDKGELGCDSLFSRLSGPTHSWVLPHSLVRLSVVQAGIARLSGPRELDVCDKLIGVMAVLYSRRDRL